MKQTNFDLLKFQLFFFPSARGGLQQFLFFVSNDPDEISF